MEITEDFLDKIKKYHALQEIFEKDLKEGIIEPQTIKNLFITLKNQEEDLYALRLHALKQDEKIKNLEDEVSTK